jgi:hypothetical protein
MNTKFGVEGDNGGFKEKISLFERGGFRYVFDRDIFVNKANLTIVSIEYIQDNDITKLKKALSPNIENRPRFFFSSDKIPVNIKNELIKEYLK